jgi:hypothetical protein
LALLNRVRIGRLAGLALLMATCGVGCGSTTKAVSACPTGAQQPSAERSSPNAPPAVPATGAYLGAFTLSGGFTQRQYTSSVTNLEAEICRPLAIVHSYLRWKRPFPVVSQLTASRSGQMLLLSWTGTDLAAMANGTDDAEIRRVARGVAALHSPVFVELRWEMDRPNLARVVGSPATFVAAWDHTRAVFAKVGVTNASWVWCPTATGFDRGTAPAYYPGGKEVDWICTDAYPQPVGPVEQLSGELAAFLAWATPRGKPLMLGEIGVPASYSPAQRAGWITTAAEFIKRTPEIKAVVYFNYHPVGTPANRDYRIDPGTPAATALRTMAADPWFRPATRATGG